MGFRFRRSIKLLPGVRVNVSGGGLSFSVGGRGATLNVSRRGTRATLGIPGTGISWSGNIGQTARTSRHKASPRAPSVQSTAAAALEARRFAANQAELQEADALFQLVDWWKTLVVELPDQSVYRSGLARRNFADSGLVRVPPQAPHIADLQIAGLNLHDARHQLGDGIAQQVRASSRLIRVTTSAATGGLLFIATAATTLILLDAGGATSSSALGGEASFGLAAVAGMIVATSTWMFGHRCLHLRRTKELAERWPSTRDALQRQHDERVDALKRDHDARVRDAMLEHHAAVERYDRERQRSEHEWTHQENERIRLLERLLGGDPDVTSRVLASALNAIDFPYEAGVDFVLDDGGKTIRLAIDLPEIEQTIPEERTKALKNGSLKTVRRTKEERATLYLHLVMGLGLSLASYVFFVLPAVNHVIVGGYTQRRARRTGALQDEFIYEIVVPRETAEDFIADEMKPLTIVSQLKSRFDMADNGVLRAIDVPNWAIGMLSET